MLKLIARRCEAEREDERSDERYRSEPARLILHGVPGAGKTQTLLWLRQFFEEVCGWVHEQQFVFLATQNTMAALIQGRTLHSYHKLTHKKTDGTVIAHTDPRMEQSSLWYQYRALRWMFIDEFSTVSLEMYTQIDDKTTQHIR